jgi:hypothetical protein
VLLMVLEEHLFRVQQSQKRLRREIKILAEAEARRSERRRFCAAIAGTIIGLSLLRFSRDLAKAWEFFVPSTAGFQAWLAWGWRLLGALILIIPALRWIVNKHWSEELKAGAIVVSFGGCFIRQLSWLARAASSAAKRTKPATRIQ